MLQKMLRSNLASGLPQGAGKFVQNID